MEFTVKERLVLNGVLPREGKDFVTLTLATNLGEKLSFTSDEIESYGIVAVNEGKNLQWKPDAPAKDIPIGPKTVVVVKDVLLALEKDNKLNADHLTLYQKFVGGVVED